MTTQTAISTWGIDGAHSIAEFAVKHMMISTVKGRFRDVQGSIELDEQHPENSTVRAAIDTASVDTGVEQRDAHLRSGDFFDTERFPTISFRSTRVEREGDDWKVYGDLTIRDVTRPVTLDVEFCGVATDPWGNLRAAFLASTEINRDEFDVSWNQALEGGGFLVGKGVRIELDVEAVREAEQEAQRE